MHAAENIVGNRSSMGSKELTHRDFIKLSDRLLMSARMVTPGSRVADIGCDHAHTDIWLVKEGIASSAIAMDVGEGPLSHARANVRLYSLEDRIEMRLSDGLTALKPGEADTIIIAGMGGTLTTLILQAGIQAARAAGELILQPQSDVWMVRRFLRRHGFRIVEEEMCIEDGKFYGSMKAVPYQADRQKQEPETCQQDRLKEKTEACQQDRQKQDLEACQQDRLKRDSEACQPDDFMRESGDVWTEVTEASAAEDLAPRDSEENFDILVNDEYGEILLQKKNPVLEKMLEALLEKNTRILEQIRETKNSDGVEKREFFVRERKMLDRALEAMKH